ncbi:MAG TPA: hypothetical protein VD884_16325 [Ohtaekwangia sp.]|nr:hypothetical protein [Ohtaekwangia sp.]
MAAERDFELLDDYIANRLSATDKIAFEKRLAEDIDLQRAYDLQQHIATGIRNARKAELKALLMAVPVPSSPTSSFTKWAGFSTVALLLGISVYFYFKPAPAPMEVAAEEQTVVPQKPAVSEKSTIQQPTEMESPVDAQELKPKDEVGIPAKKPLEEKSATPRKLDVFDPSEELTDDEENMDATLPGESKTTHEVATASRITTEVDKTNRKYGFHYVLNNDKVTLYGSFENNLYEILEFFSGEKRTVFLFYKDNYYLLDEGTEVKRLIPVNDPALLKKLMEYRNK